MEPIIDTYDDDDDDDGDSNKNQWHYSPKWSLASSRILSYSSQSSSFYPAVSNTSFSPIIIRKINPLFSDPLCSSFSYCVVIQNNFCHLSINQSNHMFSPYFPNDKDNDNFNYNLFEWCNSVIIDKQLKHDEYEKNNKKIDQ